MIDDDGSPRHRRSSYRYNECDEDSYDRAVAWCREIISSGGRDDMLFSPRAFRREIASASSRFGLPFEAVHSLFRNAHANHVKRNAHVVRSRTMRHRNGAAAAAEVNATSSRVDGRYGDGDDDDDDVERLSSTTTTTTTTTKPPRAIALSRLSREVREAVDSDPMYGPRQDKERHNIGIEYESLLEETLRSMDIPFETEAELRVRGTARTPDVLLSIPLGIRVRRRTRDDSSRKNLFRTTDDEGGGVPEEDIATPQRLLFGEKDVNISPARERPGTIDDYLKDDDDYEWKSICWIDSKALFGDVETHTNSVLPQVETYVHRFGPGLVLYWFGHAPLSRLGDGHGDVTIVGGDLPDVFLLPTGALHGRGGKIDTTA
ncbi:hypothetical protein ACHAW5_004368 [Stephanodiscus triporus]|uniref:CDAN1-interacting nuclease 1 n=1 Tax=Stephanodiscus triporus TaxID=2934178 RepID=A0ABD3Q4B4_9STRA